MLGKEFRDRDIKYERQKLIEVQYKGEKIGEYRLDMVVEGKIILELKAVSELNKIFEAELLSYLKATGMKLGVLLNFGGKKVEYIKNCKLGFVLFAYSWNSCSRLYLYKRK